MAVSQLLDALVIESSPETARRVAGLLAEGSLSPRVLEPGGALLTTPGWSGPQVVLVGLDGDQARSIAYAKWTHDAYPSAGIIAYTGDYTAETLEAAMAAGIRRVLSYPFDVETLVMTVEAVRRELTGTLDQQALRSKIAHTRLAPPLVSGEPNGDGRPHRVISVCSSKGGIGSTTLAVNLAVALQSAGRQTALVDGNFSFGSHDLFLKLAPLRSIMQTLDDSEQVRDDLVLKSLITHQTGLQVLLAPVRPEQAELIGPLQFEQIIAVLKDRHAFTVIDAWPPNDPRMLVALRQADILLVPVGPDLPAMKNLTSLLHVISLIDADQRKVTPILICAGSAPNDRVKALEAVIKRDLTWRIAGDEARVREAANTGVPFVLSSPTAEISRNVKDLAKYCMEAIYGEDGRERPQTRIGRLFRR